MRSDGASVVAETGSPGAAPPHVVLLGATADEALRDQLCRHLEIHVLAGTFTLWHQGHIQPGQRVSCALKAHLAVASLLVFLVSADFLAGGHGDGEVDAVALALRTHAGGLAAVVPVIVRACDYGSSLLGSLAALPDNGVAVTRWTDRDAAWDAVARGICAVLRRANQVRLPAVDPGISLIGPDFGADDPPSRTVLRALRRRLARSISDPIGIARVATELGLESSLAAGDDPDVLWFSVLRAASEASPSKLRELVIRTGVAAPPSSIATSATLPRKP